MDTYSALLLLKCQLKEIDPSALYIIIESPSGVLLEDLAPLLASFEAAYRKLLILRLDEETGKLLIKRQREEATLQGVSRSINHRYQRAMWPTKRDHLFPSKRRWRVRLDYLSIGREISSEELETMPRSFRRLFLPQRIELARSHISSPGYIELVGDPGTLMVLVVLLGSFLAERRYRLKHSLALKSDQRETITTLLKMGYSKEEITSISEYLNEDLSEILDRLKQANAKLAPGDEIDPSQELQSDHDRSKK